MATEWLAVKPKHRRRQRLPLRKQPAQLHVAIGACESIHDDGIFPAAPHGHYQLRSDFALGRIVAKSDRHQRRESTVLDGGIHLVDAENRVEAAAFHGEHHRAIIGALNPNQME